MNAIHPSAIIDSGAQLGAGVEVGPFSIVGARVKLGDGVRLMSHVVVTGDTEIGAGSVLHHHAVIGGGPQYHGDDGANARLVIGAGNVIREHVTMNGGSVKGGGLTTVGDKGYFMAYSHIGHDCRVGNSVTMAHCAGLSGHVVLHDGAILSGLCGVQQFGRIGKHAFIGGITGITEDIIPYGMAVGDRAVLKGLNIVGLKRLGTSRQDMHTLRAAYRAIFFGENSLVAQAEAALARWPDLSPLREIVEFILADPKRPICMPTYSSKVVDADRI